MAEPAAWQPDPTADIRIVRREREGNSYLYVDHHQIDAMKAKIMENFESQQSALVTSARMLDDGIIDPRDTRNVLGLCLSLVSDNRTLRPIQFGVARP